MKHSKLPLQTKHLHTKLTQHFNHYDNYEPYVESLFAGHVTLHRCLVR